MMVEPGSPGWPNYEAASDGRFLMLQRPGALTRLVNIAAADEVLVCVATQKLLCRPTSNTAIPTRGNFPRSSSGGTPKAVRTGT